MNTHIYHMVIVMNDLWEVLYGIVAEELVIREIRIDAGQGHSIHG